MVNFVNEKNAKSRHGRH